MISFLVLNNFSTKFLALMFCNKLLFITSHCHQVVVFIEIVQKIIDLFLLSKLGGFVNSMLDNVFTTLTTLGMSNSVPIELKTT